MENQTGQRVKEIRSDRGGEFIGDAAQTVCSRRGILHSPTPSYSPSSNGCCERWMRTVMQATRCLLIAAELPPFFWAEALAAVIHVLNRCPTASLNGVTPYEKWYGKPPDISHLRVFGSLAYALKPSTMLKKLDARSSRYIFVGYDSGTHGYRLYDPVTRRISVRRDVAFDESRTGAFLLKEHERPQPQEAYVSLFPIIIENEANEATTEDEAGPHGTEGATAQRGNNEPSAEEDLSDVPSSLEDTAMQPSSVTSQGTNDVPMSPPESNDDTEDGASGRSDLGDSEGYLTTSSSTSPPKFPPPTLGPITRSRSRLLQEDSLSLPLAQANLLHVSEPKTAREALSGPNAADWLAAITSELTSMQSHEVYDLVPPPPGAHVIGSQWVFRVKLHSDGSVDKYKARLVALGNRQKQGIDFGEVFAPVIGHDTVRCLLSLAATLDLEVHHVDIKTAFLNGTLDEQVYMRQPPGFAAPGHEGLVWRLKKSIYGLRQSPKMWNDTLHHYLIAQGFQRSVCDFGVYIKRHSARTNDMEIIGVFVDDMLLFAPTTKRIAGLKAMLSSRFSITDLGELEYYLGIQVKRDRTARTISLRQTKYIDEILERFNLVDSYPNPIPALPKTYFPKASTIPISEEESARLARTPYRQAVGSLLYVMVCTRPDIAYAVQAVSQHVTNFRHVHWEAVKRIFTYLKATRDYSLCLGGNSSLQLSVQADADWASDPSDRKSITGYLLSLNGGAFAWKSKKQSLRASSTTEAECISLWSASQVAEHFGVFLSELGLSQQLPIPVHQDNQSAIALCSAPRPKSKTLDVKHCVLQEKVASGRLKLIYTPSTAMVADCLTKPLATPLFRTLRSYLGVLPPTAVSRPSPTHLASSVGESVTESV